MIYLLILNIVVVLCGTYMILMAQKERKYLISIILEKENIPEPKSAISNNPNLVYESTFLSDEEEYNI